MQTLLLKSILRLGLEESISKASLQRQFTTLGSSQLEPEAENYHRTNVQRLLISKLFVNFLLLKNGSTPIFQSLQETWRICEKQLEDLQKQFLEEQQRLSTYNTYSYSNNNSYDYGYGYNNSSYGPYQYQQRTPQQRTRSVRNSYQKKGDSALLAFVKQHPQYQGIILKDAEEIEQLKKYQQLINTFIESQMKQGGENEQRAVVVPPFFIECIALAEKRILFSTLFHKLLSKTMFYQQSQTNADWSTTAMNQFMNVALQIGSVLTSTKDTVLRRKRTTVLLARHEVLINTFIEQFIKQHSTTISKRASHLNSRNQKLLQIQNLTLAWKKLALGLLLKKQSFQLKRRLVSKIRTHLNNNPPVDCP